MVLQLQSAQLSITDPAIGKSYLESAFQYSPQLLRLRIAGILNLQVPSLGHDLLGREGSLGISPSGIIPPFLDSRYLVEVLLLFCFRVCAREVHYWSHNV